MLTLLTVGGEIDRSLSARRFNRHRPHRSLALQPPEAPAAPDYPPTPRIDRTEILGGLINEYKAAA